MLQETRAYPARIARRLENNIVEEWSRRHKTRLSKATRKTKRPVFRGRESQRPSRLKLLRTVEGVDLGEAIGKEPQLVNLFLWVSPAPIPPVRLQGYVRNSWKAYMVEKSDEDQGVVNYLADLQVPPHRLKQLHSVQTYPNV